MKHSHLPRVLIILLFILVAGTFFVGTLRAFPPAQAKTASKDLTQKADWRSARTNISSSAYLAATPSSQKSTPTLTQVPLTSPSDGQPPQPTPSTEFPPPSEPTHVHASADTTGIIGLAILLVIVVLVGVVWGQRNIQK